MIQLKSYAVNYKADINKDKTLYVCASNIKEATDMAYQILQGDNIKQIQLCKIEPYINIDGISSKEGTKYINEPTFWKDATNIFPEKETQVFGYSPSWKTPNYPNGIKPCVYVNGNWITYDWDARFSMFKTTFSTPVCWCYPNNLHINIDKK